MAEIQIYDSAHRHKHAFKPIDPNRVTMYVCGPTVYNYIHIGNARPIVVFDTFYRLLKRHYPKVIYARNITDVDDKINKAAHEQGKTIREITDFFISAYHADIAALNTLPPDIEPRATDHIGQMQTMILALIEKGHAYVAEGHVLFDVSSMADYGALSGRDMEDMIAGARVEVAPYKKNAADFVLWKPSDATQPGWDSPWGYGRPGWHVECSAMIETHLGISIDVHGGGQDLQFPHHENEVAQSCCAHDGKEFVRYWMHNGFITMKGEKMSKSLGNIFTLHELLQKVPGEVLRYVLLSAHYRKPLDWSEEVITLAQASLDRFYNALYLAADVVPAVNFGARLDAFEAALMDDLNTPLAIAEMHAIAGELNKATEQEAAELKAALLEAGARLGLLSYEVEAWRKGTLIASEGGVDDAAIDALIAERAQAKADKNWARADAIRKELTEAGILLEDSAAGTTWKRG
jgi:cysteinyl-tRNA synthetase